MDAVSNIDANNDHRYEVAGCMGWVDATDTLAGMANGSRMLDVVVDPDTNEAYQHHNAIMILGGVSITRSFDFNCRVGSVCNGWEGSNLTAVGVAGRYNAPLGTFNRNVEDTVSTAMSDGTAPNLYEGTQCDGEATGNGACMCWEFEDGVMKVGKPRWPLKHSENIRLNLINAGLEAENPNAEMQATTTKTGAWPPHCTWIPHHRRR